MRYYVRIVGKPYYFGKACRDFLTAQIQLAHAKKAEPGLDWQIVQISA